MLGQDVADLRLVEAKEQGPLGQPLEALLGDLGAHGAGEVGDRGQALLVPLLVRRRVGVVERRDLAPHVAVLGEPLRLAQLDLELGRGPVVGDGLLEEVLQLGERLEQSVGETVVLLDLIAVDLVLTATLGLLALGRFILGLVTTLGLRHVVP